MSVVAMIVGEAPGPRQEEHAVFTGPSGARLTRLLGRPWTDVMLGVNLLGARQRLSRGGSEFSVREAAAAARMMMLCSPWFSHRSDGKVIVLAGKRVASAFGIDPRQVSYFATHQVCWRSSSGGLIHDFRQVIVIPHPSGRCRWWNDPSNRRVAGRWFRELAALAERA